MTSAARQADGARWTESVQCPMLRHMPDGRDFIAAGTALVIFGLTTLAAVAQVEVTVNGSAVDLSPAPIIDAGRVFVPLRGVFEQHGASVVY